MPETPPVIRSQALSRQFRKNTAVDRLDLTIDPGSIFAFLGPNGAGKTTTIRMLLNILPPSSGEASVLGTPTRKLRSQDFQKIGYVSENQKLPLWMTVDQLMHYLRPLYPTWDPAFSNTLLRDFDLPRNRKLKHLSRGMRMKAALISAIAFRPRLLILDEPFSGLDPLVREEFLDGIIELTAQDEWTIFVSSHDIDEVERMADQVGVINQGTLLLSDSVDHLLNSFRKVSLTTSIDAVDRDALPKHWLLPRQEGRLVTFTHSQFNETDLPKELNTRFHDYRDLAIEPLTLREIYVAIARSLKSANLASS